VEVPSSLLRIAARLVAASAALVLRSGEEAPVAAWGCDETAARALLRVRAEQPAGAASIFASLPLTLDDGVPGELLLVAPGEPVAGNATLARLAREIGESCTADRRSPDRLTRLIEGIELLGDAVAIVRAPRALDQPATFVHVNAGFARIFGYDPAEMSGVSTECLNGPRTDRDRLVWIRERMIDNQDARAVVTLYTRERTPLWTELALVPIPSAGGSATFVATFRDVTARKQFEDALAAEKRKLQTTLAAIADAVVTVLADGRVEFVNAAAQRLLGIDLVDAYGVPVDEVLRIFDGDGRRIDVVARAGNGMDAAHRGQGHLRTEAGTTVDVAYVASHIDDDGNAVVVLRDITAEHRLALKLSFEASHDPLTGLPNRRAFLERLESAVQNAHEHDGRHVVAFLDLDRFKIVNDRFGHATGDRLLREIARVMGRVVRGGDVLARIGGDEFALLLSDCRMADARRVAEKMRTAVDAYRIEHGGEVLGVGVSIGLAPIDPQTLSAAQSLADADRACYLAKASGRNVVAG
jgi:diguanylate cyclase (GGDEF)-like protein/PAS domain S-box-containing protein